MTGPYTKAGQRIVSTSLVPGHTVTLVVTKVINSQNAVVQCISCVSDTRKPYKVLVLDEHGVLAKVAEASSIEAGRAYLKATCRHGYVTENTK